MNKNFRVSFYLRGNYTNKDGKTPILMRIYIGSERMSLGNTGFATFAKNWDSKKGRCVGRTPDVLDVNNRLCHIETDLKAIFRRLEFSEELSLDRIKSEYLGDRKDDKFLLPFYDEFIETRRKEVGITRSATSIQKYAVVKKRLQEFLAFKYKRKDIKFCELRYEIISGFEHYLLTEVRCQNNTVMRMLRTFKTVIINAMKHGILDRKWGKAEELAALKDECKALQQRIDEALKAAEEGGLAQGNEQDSNEPTTKPPTKEAA